MFSEDYIVFEGGLRLYPNSNVVSQLLCVMDLYDFFFHFFQHFLRRESTSLRSVPNIEAYRSAGSYSSIPVIKGLITPG